MTWYFWAEHARYRKVAPTKCTIDPYGYTYLSSLWRANEASSVVSVFDQCWRILKSKVRFESVSEPSSRFQWDVIEAS
jgi:hypothetical protein